MKNSLCALGSQERRHCPTETKETIPKKKGKGSKDIHHKCWGYSVQKTNEKPFTKRWEDGANLDRAIQVTLELNRVIESLGWLIHLLKSVNKQKNCFDKKVIIKINDCAT